MTRVVMWLVLASVLLRPALAAPENDRSPLGMNLANIADWSASVTFVDVFRAARPFTETTPGLDVDEHGWVRRLEPGQTATTYLLWDIAGKFPHGRYKVLYDGKGRIDYGGFAKLISRREGRDLISVNAQEGGIQLNIVDTDPQDPIRNIRVIMPGGICKGDPFTRVETPGDCPSGEYLSFEDHYQEIVFNPDYLKFLRPFKVLRFMDQMMTNGSPVRTWADRAKLDDATWTGPAGVPVEVMVDLANRLDADAWFTLPHQADDDFVERFARAVKERLKPNLKVYIEYSNEVWNFAFPQASYMVEQGERLRLDPDRYAAGERYYSQRSVEIFKIFERVFGGADRLVRVLATQAANSWLADLILSHKDAAKHTDALAIAPYFGADIGTPERADKVERMTVGALFEELRNRALPQAIEWMKAHAAVAKKYKVDLIAYEAGQHLVGVTGKENSAKLNELFDAANRHRQMRQLYERYFNAWREAGGKLMVYFSSPGTYSKWGRWGITESLYQARSDAPKYDAALDYIERNARWW